MALAGVTSNADLKNDAGQSNSAKEAATSIEFKIEWPTLDTLSKSIKRTGWHAHGLPEELSLLPDDIAIPEKLQQILNWSITAGDSWASPPGIVLDAPDESLEDSIDDQQSRYSIVSRKSSIARQTPILAPDTQSVRSLQSQAVVSDSSSIRFAAEKSAWKAKFLGKITRTKPLLRKIVAPPPRPPTPTAECIVCFEEIAVHELLCMEACRHYYCKDCLSRHIVVAMGSESAFPPKCCLSPIPLHTILLSLDGERREEYQSKSAEYALAPNERWYCPNTSCTRWIPPSKLVANPSTTNYTCPFCSEAICRTCRGTAHAAGTDCPQDFGLEQVTEVAETEGWQRCYNCQAMVEHTYGCRHMTCRCRAEFCYVCGARWQTCHCTERDADLRREDVHRRRQERIAAAEAELAEIARAIAEVEALERAELEARRIREEERAREEAEQLAALEAQRLEEEAARQAAEEEAERQWNEVIRASFEDDFSKMQTTMLQVLAFQQNAILLRHDGAETALADELAISSDRVEQQYAAMATKVNDRYSQRRKSTRVRHFEEVKTLEAQHEEEEDDMFVQIQVRLRGKTNKESRMERMLAELRKSQEEAREELANTHTHALYLIEVRRKVDLTGIDCTKTTAIEAAKAQLDTQQRQSGSTIGADRKYFEMVVSRRLSMLELHRELALEEIAQRQEPSGIQDWHAAACDPVLPDFQSVEYDRPSAKACFSAADSSHVGRSSILVENSGYDTIPAVIETADLYGTGKTNLPRQKNDPARPLLTPREDAYLQPMPPPDRRPPTPPSSAVSVEAPQARRATTEAIQHLEHSSHITPNGGHVAQSYLSTPFSHHRQSSTAGSTVSSESKEPRASISSITKKGKSWFGKKKELSEEEIKWRLKHQTVGNAF